MNHRDFVVEDHPITREGIRALLSRSDDLEVVGEVASGTDCLSLLDSARPDLVLVDVAIDGADGIELTKQIRVMHPTLRVLVLSAYEEGVYAERAVRAGASGYLAKREAGERLLDAIRTVLDGRIYLSDTLRDRVVGSYLAGNASESSVADLTDRELEVFRHFGHGLTTAEVADAMMLSPKTIETHRVHIKQKLGIDSTNEFIRRAALWTAQNEV